MTPQQYNEAREILAGAALLLLAGCAPNAMEKSFQDQSCAEHGGVYEYTTPGFKSLCMDGSRHDMPAVLKPEFYPLPAPPEDKDNE